MIIESKLLFWYPKCFRHIKLIFIFFKCITTDAEVVKPSDGLKWKVAKVRADAAHDTWCHTYLHLGYLHFGSTVYCLTFRRHLCEKHPLYDMMKFHCQGTIPQITITYNVLTEVGGVGDLLFAVGNKGMMDLAAKGAIDLEYQKYSYKGMFKVIQYNLSNTYQSFSKGFSSLSRLQ